MSTAARAARRKTGRAEDFRAPAGCCAITIDIVGLTPTSCVIENVKLADLVRGFDGFAAKRTYAEVLNLFVAAFRRLKAGHDEAESACLMAWWLAFRHPTGGASMTTAVSDMMALGERVHITLHVGAAGRGLAIELSDRFVDLDLLAEHAKAANLVATVFEASPIARGRPGIERRAPGSLTIR
jgi:hypothetical protein